MSCRSNRVCKKCVGLRAKNDGIAFVCREEKPDTDGFRLLQASFSDRGAASGAFETRRPAQGGNGGQTSGLVLEESLPCFG